MALNVMNRIYANRQPQGPGYNFDQRLSSQQPTPIPGGLGGVLQFPGARSVAPETNTGRMALTVLSVGVLAVVGFNIWTRAFQA